MLRTISIFLASLFIAATSIGQDIYLKYSDECMDRFVYASAAESVAYVSYQFNLGSGKIVQLDIGKENEKWVRELPGKVYPCEALKLNKEEVRKINAGLGKVYIIRESPSHYNVSEVKKAIYIDNYKSGVEVVMKDAEFVLDMNNLLSNRNTAKPSSLMAVFLDGSINYQCVKGYILKKMENFNSDSFKEYVLIPELGIIERRSVTKNGTEISGILKLNEIGNNSFSESMVKICDGIQASYYDGNVTKTDESSAAMEKKVEDVRDAVIPTSYEETPCGILSPGFHYVAKGETLYSISRRYGVTVNNLKNWNSLSSDNINICQKLQVKASLPAMEEKEVISGAEAKDGYWVRNAEIHITRPGESVAALAQMYGYTEERFRKMNNLAPYERIYAGQELNTSDCMCPSLESTTKDKPLPYEERVEIVESLTENGNPDVYFRPIRVHQVRKSETLFSIAKLYDTTVDRVKELNGLSSNTKLVTGQRLYVQ